MTRILNAHTHTLPFGGVARYDSLRVLFTSMAVAATAAAVAATWINVDVYGGAHEEQNIYNPFVREMAWHEGEKSFLYINNNETDSIDIHIHMYRRMFDGGHTIIHLSIHFSFHVWMCVVAGSFICA